jgi:hypothetical protein
MILVVSACVLLLMATALVHYEGLLSLDRVLPSLPLSPRATVLALVIGTFAVHAVEILLYACAMDVLARWVALGAFGSPLPTEFRTLLYFSTETYTSLGYGDIVPHGPLRLLAGAETLTGLLMIGWSTSHLFVWMEQSWGSPAFRHRSRLRLPHHGGPGTRPHAMGRRRTSMQARDATGRSALRVGCARCREGEGAAPASSPEDGRAHL